MTERPAPRVLVVEDEDAIAQGLVLNLGRKGYRAEVATGGRQALERAARGGLDLILLDVRLPDLDGFEVCQRLRQRADFTPILILTARGQPDDVVYGLKLGADDYLVKPFDLAELLARVEGLLRRQAWAHEGESGEAGGAPAAPGSGETPERIDFGDFWVDFKSWRAQTRQGIVELSKKEMAVMQVFARRPNQVISRRELLAEVWELPDHPNDRVVDNVILSLRRAFEETSWRPRHIQTVRGAGYRFVP
ncbi:MAG TPA: response regulator transcription factor [Thermoanaerobaculia bacterium]|nr:response regulator transcription factor [Thermoanaerobaculia bacterium]